MNTSVNKCQHGLPYAECAPCYGPLSVMGQQSAAGMQQGQGSARIVRDNETDDEKAARLRQERFECVGVVEAPAYMPEAQYKNEYMGRTWFMSPTVKEQAEECLRVCHCHKCQKIDPRTHRIEATRFFVRFEDDPMQNYPALAHLACHRCGFEEYYPLRMDPRKQRNAQATTTYAETQMRQKMADEKLKAIQQQHDVLIRNMVVQAAKRLGVPDNMIESEADAMRRIIEREYQQNIGRGVGTANVSPYINSVQQGPDNMYGHQLEAVARSISDPDARRKFVNQALKEQGKL